MRCEDLQSRLEAYADGGMPPGEREAAADHLRNCADCRRALARIDSVAAALAQAKTPPVPTGLAARVMAAARGRQLAIATAGWNPVRWWRRVSMPMHAAAAAVLVVGLAAGLVMGWTAPPATIQAPTTKAATQGDALTAYNTDYLGDAPAGSLADSYLALVSGHNGEGR